MADALADEMLKRYEGLKATRDGIWMDNWQQISQYFIPQQSDIEVQKTEGVSGWTDKIFDTTGIECAETLKMGQYNWLTPPNQPWGEFDVPPEISGENSEAEDDATAWLGRASDITMRELSRSNFYSMAALSYLGVGVFGTDLLIVEEGRKQTLNFRHAKIGTYCIEEDEEGVVDTTMREFEMTYRQTLQMFNKSSDTIPEKMSDSAKGAKGLSKKFKFLHCIFPREDTDRLPNRKDGANKPVASVYISIEFRECIRVSGYDEQPALCSRWDKWGTGAPWGYSPAFLSLPIARQLNYVQQYLDALAELHAYPRILTPDNLDGDVDLRAGGATVFDSSNPNSKPEEWATVGDYKMGMEMQDQRRKAMRDAFMADAFKLLNSEPLLDKKMTAYEISQRQAEVLQSFTPSLGRRVTEFLNPLLIRCFGILFRAGKFGQAPDSLMADVGNGKRGLALPSVVITNRMTDALRALKNRGTEETFQFLLPQMQFKPDALDIFDMDAVNREYAKNAGMPPDLIRKQKGQGSVEQIRAARAQQVQAQQAAQLAEQMGKAGKNLAGSPDWMQEQAKASAGA
jgi:hypothetical protein